MADSSAALAELQRRMESYSPEQKAALQELLRRRQGSVSAPPAYPKAPIPAALSGPPLSIGQRALSNLPGSALNLARTMSTLSGAPGGLETGSPGGGFPDMGWDAGLLDPLRSLGNVALHPEESFAEDPAGTISGPALMALGAVRGGGPVGDAMHGAVSGLPDAFTNLTKHVKLNEPLSVLPAGYDFLHSLGKSAAGGLRGDVAPLEDLPQPFTPNPNIARKIAFTPGPGGGGMPSAQSGRVPAVRPSQRIPDLPEWPAAGVEETQAPAGPIPPVTATPAQSMAPLGSSVVPANAQTFKHPAVHTDLIRQMHAVRGELGFDAKALSKAATDVYGKSLSQLSYDQALALHEYMLKNKGLPTKPGDLLPE